MLDMFFTNIFQVKLSYKICLKRQTVGRGYSFPKMAVASGNNHGKAKIFLELDLNF